MDLQLPKAACAERKEQRIRRTLLKLAQPSQSCVIVNKPFNLSETQVTRGITSQGFLEPLGVSDFLTPFI